MANRGFFITGTDTGVGKTYVARLIVRALTEQGIDAGVMKPVETGCSSRRGMLVPQDAVSLVQAAGAMDDLDLVNPCRYRLPLAPFVAAQQEGWNIRIRRLVHCYRELAGRHAFMVVEGAGGILVPITKRYAFLDLAGDIGLPVLIIARPGLGTINHTLLTVQALASRKIGIAGIIVNHAVAAKRDLASRTNPGVIERLSGVPVLGVIEQGRRTLPAGIRRWLEERCF